jgi:DeoR/GlpR family transcriptional regulator of sugar metabolism
MSIYAILQQDKKVVVNDLAEKFGVTKSVATLWAL